MATIDVKDAAGATVAIEKPLAPGRGAAAASRPVALSAEDFAVLDGLETAIASTNTKLDTAIAAVDTLETLIASTNTKLDTAITALQIIDNLPGQITATLGTKSAATSLSVALSTEDALNLDNVDAQTSRLATSATGIAPGSIVATTSFVTGGQHLTTQKTLTNAQGASHSMSERGALIVNPGVETFGVVDTAVATAVGLVETAVVAVEAAIDATAATTVDHDAVDSGGSLKMGTRAVANLSGATLVAAGDRADNVGGLDGAIFTRQIPLGDLVRGTLTNTDGAATDVIAAGAAGIKHYLLDLELFNTSAGAVTCLLLSGAVTIRTYLLPAGSGVVRAWPHGLAPNAAAEAWRIDVSAATTSVIANMSGFKSKI